MIPTGEDEILVVSSAPRERFMRELRLDLETGFHGVLQQVVPWLAAAVRVLQEHKEKTQLVFLSSSSSALCLRVFELESRGLVQ